MLTLKVHLYYSKSNVAPDGFIENAIECFRFPTNVKEPLL